MVAPGPWAWAPPAGPRAPGTNSGPMQQVATHAHSHTAAVVVAAPSPPGTQLLHCSN
jgi:hypothetical protein